ncbi:S41 family peptidase [Aquimarina hainanensis]|uniref:S41 family peptidase n=1 Tax=Aquimarina hainanensis TaxID=1578017 RepID=A0ABW5NCN8_9FLAO
MKNILRLIVCLPLLCSCENAIFEEDMASTNPRDNFDYLWRECNEKYAYFDLKQVDWDNIYTTYAARIDPNMSDDALFTVMGEMLTELKDDHTNLISNFNISSFGVEYLGQDNYDERIIKEHYLSDNYYRSGPFIHDFIADGTIGYVRFPSFTGTVDYTNLDFILQRYRNTKGLIIDLRENGGGAVSDVSSLLSRFVTKKTLVGYSRLKNGPGHNDFSDDEEMYISPGGITYTKKVMMLIDRGTYSAGSFTALATKAMPNILLVGDTTGGGLGLPNGGQLPNGWRYRFSVSQTLDLTKDNQYENGVPADIHALFNWEDRTKDEIIERAILEILN